MSFASAVQSLLPSVERNGNLIRDMWDRIQGLPGGPLVFSKLVGQAAPYTASVDARIVELRQGYARVTMADRRSVRNHLRSVHAIALTNLAELTGNIAMAYALPDDGRFIVSGLEIDYVKKARGTITGECHCPTPSSSERCTYVVPVRLLDDAGDVVAEVKLKTLVGPKRS